MSPVVKKYFLTFLKLGVSLFLIGLLINRLDTQVLLNLPKRFNPWFLVPLTILFTSVQFLGAWRWQQVLRCHGLRQGIVKGTYLYLVGYFYNNFLPTAIGGDLVRGYEAAKELGSAGKIASSILIERIMGLIACLFLALLFLPMAQPPLLITGMVLVLNLFSFLGIAMFFWDQSQKILRKVVKLAPESIRERLYSILLDLEQIKRHRKGLFTAFAAALLYQGALIWVAYLAGFFAQIESVTLADYLVFVPLVWVVSLLPISFNALGIREISFSYFFGILGASSENGFLVSLIFFATILLTGLIGGIMWGIFVLRSYFIKTKSKENVKPDKISFSNSLVKKNPEI